MELFKEATFQERKLYYAEEWSPDSVPLFLRESLQYREFGFDHDGNGPRDRYNQFQDMSYLSRFLKDRAPYSAYSSVSYYEKPRSREGYRKAELVFDIDAKDLPSTLKKCCEQGRVCEKCLDVAKGFMLSLKDIFKGDFGLEGLHYIYSGRGYHLRILDPDAMEFTDVERAYILDYLTGSQDVKTNFKVDFWVHPHGYTKVFKDRLLMTLRSASVEDLMSIEDIGAKTAEKIIQNRDKIIDDVQNWRNFDFEEDKRTGLVTKRRFKTLNRILKEKRYDKFTDFVLKQNASMLDAKVTVDVKRILRLPSSLHSKVSFKCMEVRDLEKFDPLSDAMPKFVSERSD